MIKAWKGDFGQEYTKRNQYNWKKRIPLYKKMLKGLPITKVLEVGSNCGLNLLALENLGYLTFGIEPNSFARKMAKDAGLLVFPGTAVAIPFPNESKDLVFTCGVLIHVPPKELEASMKEMIRVSKKYILAIEYEAPKETMVVYRGKRDMLWKRPYGKMYKKLGLKLIGEGKTDIDRCRYWLFVK